jgi:hypothetical protein
MKHSIMVRHVFLCITCIALVSSSAFAKSDKTETTSGTAKTGIVTAMSLDVKKSTVTITLAVGSLKSPDTNLPKCHSAADLIELTGETVTFTVAADTEVACSMMDGLFAPKKDDAPVPSDDKRMPPPPEMNTTISKVSLNDVLTVTFDTTGATVTNISDSSTEPLHGGPEGMGAPRPDGNRNQGGPQGGFTGQGPQGGRR